MHTKCISDGLTDKDTIVCTYFNSNADSDADSDTNPHSKSNNSHSNSSPRGANMVTDT